MQEKAYAKINLYLHVTGKRDDGYHLLDSLAVFPDIGDCLSVVPADLNQKELVSLKLTGEFAKELADLDPRNNLIIKAADKLVKYAEQVLPAVGLVLEKNLPVASGIGGGSSDAAATLRLLIRYWQLTIPDHVIEKIAVELGADVPVCLNPKPQRMTGIGEVLTPVQGLPSFGMILVNHGEAVSTADVFHKRTHKFSDVVDLDILNCNFDQFMNVISSLSNDLQDPACKINPMIQKVLSEIQVLPGCRLARMSGSGATCFGLFQTQEEAQQAAIYLSKQYKWWVWGGSGMI